MSRNFKIISGVWLLICVSSVVFGVFQSHSGNPEGGIAPALLITLLTVPLGILVQLVYVGISNLFSSSTSMGQVGNILLYSAMIGVGYWQWFILLPKIVKSVGRDRSPKVWGMVAIGVIAILYELYPFYIHVFPNIHMN